MHIIYGHEDRIKGAYNRISCSGHKSDIDDTIKDDRFLDTPDKGGDGHKYYSSSGFHRCHGHHHYHPYRRSDMGYFLDDFKKSNQPTFDGEMKTSQDAESWLLGMNKFS